MENTYTVKILAPGDDLSDAFAVRMAVFVDEQGFDPALEIDELDGSAYHVVLYDRERPVATGRVFPGEEPGLYVIGRVAVLPACRGGAGRMLMAALEQEAKRLGARAITLGAQCRVRGFYEKLGYSACGEMYYDEFCPHIHMRRAL